MKTGKRVFLFGIQICVIVVFLLGNMAPTEWFAYAQDNPPTDTLTSDVATSTPEDVTNTPQDAVVGAETGTPETAENTATETETLEPSVDQNTATNTVTTTNGNSSTVTPSQTAEMTSTAAPTVSPTFDSMAIVPGKIHALTSNPEVSKIKIADQNLRSDRSPTAVFEIRYVEEGQYSSLGTFCGAFPDSAKTALVAAAGIWGTLVTSPVNITLEVCWTDLAENVVAEMQTRYVYNRANFPQQNTAYPIALANALQGEDLDPTLEDISISFDSTGDFYFGTDGNLTNTQTDFMTAALHVIAHGLGFSGSMEKIDDTAQWGRGTNLPDIFDRFATNADGHGLTDGAYYPNTSTALLGALTSGNAYFGGANAKAQNSGNLVKLYAPTTWDDAFSYENLDETFRNTSNGLMVYSINKGASIHHPGSITMGILRDIGWTTTNPQFPTYTDNKYDDTESKLVYSGWTATSPAGQGDYSGTLHLSTTPGSTIQFSFIGSALQIWYRTETTYGTIDLVIDGMRRTISQNAAHAIQQSYTFDGLGYGQHYVYIEHNAGATVSFDAFQVIDYANDVALNPGTYDDTNSNLTYTSWVLQNLTSCYHGTEHYSATLLARIDYSINGSGMTLVYRTHPLMGTLDVWIDGALVTTLNQYAATGAYQQSWSITTLTGGVHTVALQHRSGTYVNLDSIIVGGVQAATATNTVTATPRAAVGRGYYDDADSALNYSSNWSSNGVSGNYQGTEHYTTTARSSGDLYFTGDSVTVVYRTSPGFGFMGVEIDGAVPTVINLNATAANRQLKFIGGLPSGTHHLVFYLDSAALGATVAIGDIDAFIVGTPDAGTYDDTDLAVTYEDSWYPQTLNGDFNSTEHYTNTLNKSARMYFRATTKSLLTVLYRDWSTDCSNMQIEIYTWQDALVGAPQTIVPGAAHYQRPWRNDGALPIVIPASGDYYVKITNLGTKYVILDAIILTEPVGVGTYDDTDENIEYVQWNGQTGGSNYNGSLHYSIATGGTSRFRFTGHRFDLYFRKHPTFGNMTVTVYHPAVELPGNIVNTDAATTTATINQYNISDIYQQSWTSAGVYTLPATDEYLVVMNHTSGSSVTLDMILVSENSPLPINTATLTPSPTYTNTPGAPGPLGGVGAQIYNDTNAAILYQGTWGNQPLGGDYLVDEHYSSVAGSRSEFTFDGTAVTIIFRKHYLFGNMQVSIDGGTAAIVNQYSASAMYQQSWTSPVLADGVHRVRITHNSGWYITLDGIIVLDTPVASSLVPYTFGDPSIGYTDTWTNAGTYKSSSTIGAVAALPFNGGVVAFTYPTDPTFGTMSIAIDGGTPAVISQAAVVGTATWTSTYLAPGDHIITLTHTSGTTVGITSFLFSASASTPTATSGASGVLAVGTYNDNHANLTYSVAIPAWTYHALIGCNTNDEHYSQNTGNFVSFRFNGTGFRLIFRRHPQFGAVNISIDGTVVATLNQYGASNQFQQTWESNNMLLGVHTVQITHASNSTTYPYVNVDAVQILDNSLTPTVTVTPSRTPTNALTPNDGLQPPLEPGKYDDMDTGITYTSWAGQTLAANYANTEHYSAVVGSTATLRFKGNVVSLFYRVHPTFRTMNIKIDGTLVATLNQYGAANLQEQIWSSDVLASNVVHTMTLTHTSGSYVTLDAVNVSNALNVGTYQDIDPSIVYSSHWQTDAVAHFTTSASAIGRFWFYGDQFTVNYTTGVGKMNISVDGGVPVVVDQTLDIPPYNSPTLTYGVHYVTLTYQSGGRVEVDDVSAINTGATAVSRIVSGYNHTCAITNTGGVKCWGNNDFGQLGNNSTTKSNIPVSVTGLTSGVVGLTAGENHTCALTTAGAIKCWGRNTSGQLGDGTVLNRLSPVTPSGYASGAKAVSAGKNFTCGINSGDALKCWGANNSYQLGTGTSGDYTNRSTPTDVFNMYSDVKAVSAGDQHACAILNSTGKIFCWGNNTYGQLGTGVTSTTPSFQPEATVLGAATTTSLSSGANHTCATVTGTNALLCWGRNNEGQIGDSSLTDRSTPVNPTGLATNVLSVAAGGAHTCAVLTTGGGTTRCWGRNTYGQVGIGNNTTPQNMPQTIAGLLLTGVASGSNHSCGVLADFSMKCWGYNFYGQLGNATYTDSNLPVVVQ